MKNFIQILILLIFFSSCSTLRTFTEKDNSIEEKQTEIIETTKKGGVTSLVVPNVIYKDTVITKVNYETKTILRTTFDDKGNQQIDCEESEINERITRIEEQRKKDIETESLKKNDFNPQYLIYSVIGLGVVVLLVMGVFSFLIIEAQKQLQTMLAEIIKK